MHPTSGSVDLLGEPLGRVDIFELRPMIGLASQELAETIPVEETALNVVVTAGYGVVGRWRETYEELDTERAQTLLDRSEEHTSELQSRGHLVCRLLLEKKKK